MTSIRKGLSLPLLHGGKGYVQLGGITLSAGGGGGGLQCTVIALSGRKGGNAWGKLHTFQTNNAHRDSLPQAVLLKIVQSLDF
jgi:hypothetical protein